MYSQTVKSDGQLHRPHEPPPPPPMPLPEPPVPQLKLPTLDGETLLLGALILLLWGCEKRDMGLIAALAYILLE